MLFEILVIVILLKSLVVLLPEIECLIYESFKLKCSYQIFIWRKDQKTKDIFSPLSLLQTLNYQILIIALTLYFFEKNNEKKIQLEILHYTFCSSLMMIWYMPGQLLIALFFILTFYFDFITLYYLGLCTPIIFY